jgi:protein tyrosine phosphatase type 4A
MTTNSPEGKLFNMPTLIEYENLRFLIMDAPNDGNLALYLKVCR